jgi:hypothetical protein
VTTFADLLEARRGDPHPGLVEHGRSLTWDEVVHEADRRAMLQRYLNNCDQMRHYKTTVFNKLGEMETMLKDDSWFHPTGLQKMEAAEPVLKLVSDLMRVWEEMYPPTYQMWEKLARETNIDKVKLEELHVHGAQMRLAEIRKLEQQAH